MLRDELIICFKPSISAEDARLFLRGWLIEIIDDDLEKNKIAVIKTQKGKGSLAMQIFNDNDYSEIVQWAKYNRSAETFIK